MFGVRNLKFLLLVFLLAWQIPVYTQDKSGGGGVQEEILMVDKNVDYHPSKIKLEELPRIGKYRRIGKKVQHFLQLASADISKCKNSELKFTSIRDFHLYLVASHAFHTIQMVTADSFVDSDKTCQQNGSDDKPSSSCAFSKESIDSLKDLIKKKVFHNYLMVIEGASLREAHETEKYFTELFK